MQRPGQQPPAPFFFWLALFNSDPMAKTFLRWNHNHKVFHVLGLFSLLVLVQNGGAFEFKVGGSSIWAVPTDPKVQNYNQWAENSWFQIGDSLRKSSSENSSKILSRNENRACWFEDFIQKFLVPTDPEMSNLYQYFDYG
ncbi:hypothetical protein U1Q18_005180 [Sarracenia purpurea var. burkii]